MSPKESTLTLTALKEVLRYEFDTGRFLWASTAGGVTLGAVAGNVNTTGYWVVGINGQKYRQHRLAWLWHYGAWPVGTIDHIDTDRSNNHIANLRDVSQATNKQNMRRPTAANTSGFLGVYWSRRRNGFMASVGFGRKKKRRGPYRTAERAYSAYVDLKRTHHDGCTL